MTIFTQTLLGLGAGPSARKGVRLGDTLGAGCKEKFLINSTFMVAQPNKCVHDISSPKNYSEYSH